MLMSSWMGWPATRRTWKSFKVFPPEKKRLQHSMNPQNTYETHEKKQNILIRFSKCARSNELNFFAAQKMHSWKMLAFCYAKRKKTASSFFRWQFFKSKQSSFPSRGFKSPLQSCIQRNEIFARGPLCTNLQLFIHFASDETAKKIRVHRNCQETSKNGLTVVKYAGKKRYPAEGKFCGARKENEKIKI